MSITVRRSPTGHVVVQSGLQTGYFTAEDARELSDKLAEYFAGVENPKGNPHGSLAQAVQKSMDTQSKGAVEGQAMTGEETGGYCRTCGSWLMVDSDQPGPYCPKCQPRNRKQAPESVEKVPGSATSPLTLWQTETLRRADVMREACKEGAVVELRHRDSNYGWRNAGPDTPWHWVDFDYRVTFAPKRWAVVKANGTERLVPEDQVHPSRVVVRWVVEDTSHA